MGDSPLRSRTGSVMVQRVPLFPLILVIAALTGPVTSWCTTAGGVGEYSTKCPSSVDFEACFAMCQCYDANDNPTHEHQAICVLDECFCVFEACPLRPSAAPRTTVAPQSHAITTVIVILIRLVEMRALKRCQLPTKLQVM